MKKEIKIDMNKVRPFVGSESGWKCQHGNQWKKARKNYIKDNLNRIERIKEKHGKEITIH